MKMEQSIYSSIHNMRRIEAVLAVPTTRSRREPRSHPAAIGKRHTPPPSPAHTHTHTHTHTDSLLAAVASKDRRRRLPWLRRPIALLAAFSFLLATSACESFEENPEYYYYVGGGVAVAVIVAIVALSGGGDSDSDNGNGNGDNGNGGNGDLPGAPTSLEASANGSTAIDLSWEAPADDGGSAITGYQIEYRQGSAGDWMDAEADTGDAETDYSHTGLTAETEYSYRISAINAIGTGPASNEATATTTSLADDPKPGAPTNFMATAGDRQVTLAWEDPMHCGSGDLCSETAHQHWLEYKLTSAADDAWANGAVVVSGSEHATSYMVTGLTNGMSYDFRLAVQLTGENDRGPWANPVSAQPAMGAVSGMDSDGDGEPDSTDPDDDNDGVADTSDAFPLDACASVDSDGDGSPDTVLAAGSTAPGGSAACSAASTLTEDIDDDDDGAADIEDVDDDNDGLIEIATRAELENMRYNLAGSSSKDSSGAAGDTTGAPTTEPVNCDDSDSGTTNLLCGYELANNIDIDGFGSDNVTCDSSKKWAPIGGCGSDGECGETSSNDDDPFSAIFEGNGFMINNVCIEAVVESADRHDILGLFGHLGDATVQNLAIAEIYIESSFTGGIGIGADADSDNNRLGALAGYVSGSTTILNVTAADSYSDIDLQGATTNDFQYIGGLVGEQAGGSITASFAAVDANGGDGANDFAGGLVGVQDDGSIIASFATGDADGGDGSQDRDGGLVGEQAGGSIVASYATGDMASDIAGGLVGFQAQGNITASFAIGDVDGGGRPTDLAGGLVGVQAGSITASYGFGMVPRATNTTGSSSDDMTHPWPAGVTAAAALTADNAGAGWSPDVWDFGDSSQAPALRYISGYTFDDGDDDIIGTDDDRHTYSCAAASFPASLAVTCGSTLLPGPDGSPQDRQ